MKILNVLNPDTLEPYSCSEELQARQAATGEMQNGLMVMCPATGEQVHRAVCMFRPHPHCPFCRHRIFDLFFDPGAKYELVACPRWESEKAKAAGELPETYVLTEVATCTLKPFTFCGSCPSSEELAVMHCEKVRPGWYSRWKRVTDSLLKEESDG